MKWFKHYSDAHDNLKLRALVDSYGWDGYGIWWIICEICAKEGKSEENWGILGYKRWRDEIIRITGVEKKRLYRILNKMAKLRLIDGNELKMGNLCVPQMKEYCDDYSERVQRKSEQCSDNVPLEEKRRDKNRLDKKRRDNSSSKKKPYFKGKEMRYSQDKWWILPGDGGEWLEFNAKESDIEYK